MAEFSEVMRQAQRMCEYRRKHGLKCNDCDAVHICGLKISHVGLDTLCADADAVMSWAAEHPIVYPTWGEYFGTIYGARLFGNPIGSLDEIFKLNIPQHIAEKLGVEPKEDV